MKDIVLCNDVIMPDLCFGEEYDRDVIGKDMLKGYMQHADVQG